MEFLQNKNAISQRRYSSYIFVSFECFRQLPIQHFFLYKKAYIIKAINVRGKITAKER